MERSLTVLLPVHNVQSTLARIAMEILEVVSDLTGQFELIIIDDGSTDATSEVASELTQRYPQVRAICHVAPQGRDAAIRDGLQQSTGEVIFFRDPAHGHRVEGIRRLWHTVQQQSTIATARQTRTKGPSRRISHHGTHQDGYLLIDRCALEDGVRSRPSRPNFLLPLKRFALGE